MKQNNSKLENFIKALNRLKEAYSAGIIEDEKLCMNMLIDRNSTSQMYNENNAIEICKNIKEEYTDALEKLKDNIITRIGYMG